MFHLLTVSAASCLSGATSRLREPNHTTRRGIISAFAAVVVTWGAGRPGIGAEGCLVTRMAQRRKSHDAESQQGRIGDGISRYFIAICIAPLAVVYRAFSEDQLRSRGSGLTHEVTCAVWFFEILHFLCGEVEVERV